VTFIETHLKGAFLIDLQPHTDDRGFLARTYCHREFQEHGLNPRVVQCNISFNNKAGTLRGIHYQRTPFGEAKLVRCIRGAIYDVIIDLRSDSLTYRGHFAVELTEQNRRALYVPESFAHGFQTLADNCEIEYQMSEFYEPRATAGYRYNDPVFAITWPLSVTSISDQDAEWPLIT
jgi:dTDP-4-dehydrorhamnose 3,5-epimerase